MEVLHHKVHDGTVQYARLYEGEKPAILVFPDFGESLKDEFWMLLRGDLPKQTTCVVELRGHALSAGDYSLQHHWEDIQYWLLRSIKEHKEVIVIAKGLSASLLLHYESQVHLLHEKHRPPLPIGMILLDPWFEGRRTGWKHCRKTSKYVLKKLEEFVLAPVRVQTPTKVFIQDENFTVDHLKRIFGTCKTEKVRWLRNKQTRIELRHGLRQVGKAVRELTESERPIRFSTRL